ncbi:MAG TPA: iron-containing alcohol dehydrogenase [Bacillota bacterium]
MNFNYYIPTKILFGPGRLNDLGTMKLPGKKAMLVISSGPSLKENGIVDRVLGLLSSAGVKTIVFDRIQPNPIKSHVMEGAALVKKEGCDFLIGLGGGSSIDSAKSIAVMARNPGDYWDYISGGSGKGMPVQNGVMPVVAITTTAGTGTEADPWTVITKEETGEKIGFGTPETFPVISIVDPELMLTVPPKLTAFQGFDALFHAAEGYIANCATPVSELYSLKSIELLAKYLPIAVKDGGNLEARTMVALANTLAGMVESTSSCTSEHSMEHALSGFKPELPHGAGLIMLSLAYFEFFTDKVPERMAAMAEAMGEPTGTLSPGEKKLAFVHVLQKLQTACGVDQLKISDYGIKKEDLPGLARQARATMGGLFEMDRYRLSLEETIGIMQKAYR